MKCHERPPKVIYALLDLSDVLYTCQYFITLSDYIIVTNLMKWVKTSWTESKLIRANCQEEKKKRSFVHGTATN